MAAYPNKGDIPPMNLNKCQAAGCTKKFGSYYQLLKHVVNVHQYEEPHWMKQEVLSERRNTRKPNQLTEDEANSVDVVYKEDGLGEIDEHLFKCTLCDKTFAKSSCKAHMAC